MTCKKPFKSWKLGNNSILDIIQESVGLSQQKSHEYSQYQHKCDLLLQDDEIRFAGLINSMGRLVAGGFKQGITPLEDQAEQRKMFMELALRVSMRMEFDYSLGPVKYSASRREKVVMLSFPINNNVLMVSAKTSIDIDKLARKVMRIIGKA